MNYADIRPIDVANGPGIRVSLFVSGCTHACPGCFNPEAWDFQYGTPFGEEQEQAILDAMEKSYIKGLSLLGGEPFHPNNQKTVLELVKKVRAQYPQKDIWCYSGYLYDSDMQPGGRVYTEHTQEILKCLDVLVDGEFVEAEKDLTLVFRGSSNQRLLKLKDGIACGNWP